MGPGGPRDSNNRAAISVGLGPSSRGTAGSIAKWSTVTEAMAAAGGRVVSDACAVIVHSQSEEGQTPCCVLELASRESGQPSSLASLGERQQQNHSVTPQARPSQRQVANACGTAAENSSAIRVRRQIVRVGFTHLLSNDPHYNCNSARKRREGCWGGARRRLAG